MSRYTSDLTVREVDSTIQAALNMWAKVTPLTFTKKTSGPADIELSFDKAGQRGYTFDGRGGVLAYANFPGDNAGRILL